MKSDKFKRAYTHIAIGIVSIMILASAILYATDSARAQQQKYPVVSIEQPWFYVNNQESPTVTIKLDKPANKKRATVSMVIDVYSIVCDPVCRFEPVAHKDGLGESEALSFSFGEFAVRTSIAVTAHELKGALKANWPSVAYPEKALMVARLDKDSAFNATVADGHDAFRFPNIVSANSETIAVSADSETVIEGDRSYIPVRRLSPISDTMRVSYELVDETAVWNKDYLAKRSGVLTFDPDKEVAKIPFQATQNDTFSKTKMFKVNLSDPPGLPFSILDIGPGAGGAIENDDPMPTLTISGSTRYDTSSRNIYFDYEFELSEPSEEPVIIAYKLPFWHPGKDKTPYGGLRFDRHNTTTLEIGANKTSATSQGAIFRIDELAYELGNRISLEVVSVTNATYGKLGEDVFADKQATEVAPEPVQPALPPPTLSIEQTWQIWEGGDKYLTYNLDRPSKDAVLFSVVTSFHELVCDPERHFVKDGNYISEGFRIPPGEVSLSPLWTGYNNPPNNATEGIFVAEIDAESVKGAKISDDGSNLPSILTASYEPTIHEGELSHITLRLNQPSEIPINLSYEFEDDSAVLGKHYAAKQKGAVTFRPGKKIAKIPYRATQNNIYSEETQFSVILSPQGRRDAVFLTAGNELADSATASIKIVDDDPLPIISIYSPGHEYDDTRAYIFRLSHPSDKTAKITIKLNYYSSTLRESRVLEIPATFPPGSTQTKVEVTRSETSHDSLPKTPSYISVENAVFKSGLYIYTTEPGEFIDPSHTHDRQLWKPDYGTPKERDDTIKVVDARAVEGQIAEFEIVLSEPLAKDLIVTYIAREISDTLGIDKTSLARMDLDFKREKRTVVIAAGSTSTLAYIWTLEDKRQESDERFVVEIVEMSEDGLSAIDGYVTIEDNDDTPPSMYIFSTDTFKQNGKKFVEIRLRLTTTSYQPVTETLEVFSNKSGDDTSVTTIPVTFAPGETRHILRFAVEDDE